MDHSTLPKKPTETFGTLVFGKDGRVRPNFQRLPEDKEGHESGVAERFIRLGSDYADKGARFELHHDFQIFVGRKLVATVQNTEFRFKECVTLKTQQEYTKEARGDQTWISFGRGKMWPRRCRSL